MDDRDIEFLKLTFPMHQSEDMARMQRYVERGRRFRDIPTQELKARWVIATKHWCANLLSPGSEIEAYELGYELRIRDEEPPIDQVEEDMKASQHAVEELVAALKKDPARLQAANRTYLEKLAEFYVSIEDETKN